MTFLSVESPTPRQEEEWLGRTVYRPEFEITHVRKAIFPKY